MSLCWSPRPSGAQCPLEGEGDSGQHTLCSRGHWVSVPPRVTKRKQRPECPSCSQPRFGWARGPDQLRPKEAWLWDNGPETQSCLSRTESMKILASDVNTALTLRCRREHVHRGRDCVHCEAGAPGWRVACQPLQHLGSTWWASSHATRVPRGRRSRLQGALHGSRGWC